MKTFNGFYSPEMSKTFQKSFLQGHNLQGVCSLSSWLGPGLPLPHRCPQQLHQPSGVWTLLPWGEEGPA